MHLVAESAERLKSACRVFVAKPCQNMERGTRRRWTRKERLTVLHGGLAPFESDRAIRAGANPAAAK